MQLKNISARGIKCLNEDYEFGDFTIITGPNGSGKTALINSIELICQDIIGGLGKSNDAIFSLAPDGRGSMMVGCELNDPDFELQRTWDRVEKKNGNGYTISKMIRFTGQSATSQGKFREAEAELKAYFRPSLFGVNPTWFSDMTSTERRKVILSLLANASEAKKSRELPEWIYNEASERVPEKDKNKAVIDFLSEIIPEICEGASFGNVIDQISAVDAEVKKQLKDAKRELATVEATLKSLGFDGALSVDTSRIETLKADKKRLNGEISGLDRKIETGKQNAKSRADIIRQINVAREDLKPYAETPVTAGVQEQYDEAEKEVNNIRGSIQDLKNEIHRMLTGVTALQNEVASLSEIETDSDFTCEKCGSDITADQYGEFIGGKIEVLNEKIKADESGIETKRGELEKLDQTLRNREKTLEIYKAELDDCETRDVIQGKIITFEKRLGEIPDVAIDMLEADYRVKTERRDSIDAELEKLIAAETKAQTFAKSDAAKYKMRVAVEAYKILAETVSAKGIAGELIREFIAPLEERMTEVFGTFYDDRKFYINFQDDRGNEVCDFGFEMDGNRPKWETISGAEKILLSLSLAISLCLIDTSATMRVLLIDNADSLNDENYTRLMHICRVAIAHEWLDNIIVAGWLGGDRVKDADKVIELK